MTHEFTSLKGPHGEKIFEAYADNQPQQPIEYFGTTVPARIKSQ